MNFNIIGISGFARCGKDTAFEAIHSLCPDSDINRLAFADALKEECKDFLESNIGISPFTEITSEKKIIRPFLVTYGTHLRRKLDNKCWINKVDSKIQENKRYIITDMRYLNEVEWVKSKGGKSIYIYRQGISAANDEEEKNNSQLTKNADLIINIPTFKNNYKDKCKEIIKKELTKHGILS